jgi:hypothetical protein
MPVQTPSGTQTVAAGDTLTLPTRRPDEQPTSDLARCQSVTANSFVPGDEPVAAVDGSTATPWEAAAPQATLTVQLSGTSKLRSATVTRGQRRYVQLQGGDLHRWEHLEGGRDLALELDRHRSVHVPADQGAVRPAGFPGGSGTDAPAIDELSVSP